MFCLGCLQGPKGEALGTSNSFIESQSCLLLLLLLSLLLFVVLLMLFLVLVLADSDFA